VYVIGAYILRLTVDNCEVRQTARLAERLLRCGLTGMSELDKHVSLPFLYLAIGHFCVVKGGGETYPRFPSVTWF